MRTIVVGVDGSTQSELAVAWAVPEAAGRDAGLLLCHVLEPSAADLAVDGARVRPRIGPDVAGWGRRSPAGSGAVDPR